MFITLKNAYMKMCKHLGAWPVVMGCRDYGDAYSFFVAPPGSDPQVKQFAGVLFVSKKNGAVFKMGDSLARNLTGKEWIPVDVSSLRRGGELNADGE